MTLTIRPRPATAQAKPSAAELRWAVRVAGSTSPGERLAQALDLLDAADPDGIARTIVEEKLVSLTLRTLRDRRPALARRVEDHPEMASHVARLARANASMAELIGAVEEASPFGSTVALMKGAAARSWYPEPLLRDVGDLDLMVCCADHAFGLARNLRSLGYAPALWEPPWVKRTYGDDATYGQLNLVSPEGKRLAVDIHFGGYSVRHCGFLPAPREVSDATFQLACVIANAAGDCKITGKDLNDVALATVDGGVQLTDLAEVLDDCQLNRFLSSLLALVLTTHDLPDEVEREFVRCMATYPPERPDADQKTFEWQRRWAATVLHAWKVGSRRSTLVACRTSSTAAVYYSRRLRLRRTRFSRTLRWHTPAPWTCVRLIPLTVDVDGVAVEHGAPAFDADEGLRRGTLGRHQVVVSGDQVFAPTVFYGLPADVLSKVRGMDP